MKFSIVAGIKRDWVRISTGTSDDWENNSYPIGTAIGRTAKTLNTAGTAAGTATEAWVGRRIFDTAGTATGTATESVVSG